MTQKFHKGDRVEWNSGQGTSTGEVQKKVTQQTEVDGHAVDASEDSPRYLVMNDNTGNVTGHHPESLRPVQSTAGQDESSASSTSGESDREAVFEEFTHVINMTAKQLQDWLQTDESNAVGQDAGDGEATGHKSGRRIVELLQKNKADYTESDYSHMNKVVGYVHRHSAQKPSGDIKDTRWRYSLMNWGHDPLKD